MDLRVGHLRTWVSKNFLTHLKDDGTGAVEGSEQSTATEQVVAELSPEPGPPGPWSQAPRHCGPDGRQVGLGVWTQPGLKQGPTCP